MGLGGLVAKLCFERGKDNGSTAKNSVLSFNISKLPVDGRGMDKWAPNTR